MSGTLKDWARTIKRDAHAVYLAARDPRTPWYAKALAICVAGYALSPIDLIPDFDPCARLSGRRGDYSARYPGRGQALVPQPSWPKAEPAAALAAERPVSRTAAAAVIALIWAASMALTAWLGYRYCAG
jgi:hypothetical protein